MVVSICDISRNVVRYIVLTAMCFGFLSGPHSLFAAPCVVTLKATATQSTCTANAVVTAVLTGTDLDKVTLSNAQYKIQSTGPGFSTSFGKNGGVFEDVAPGNYTVTMRAFCSNAGVEVDYQSTTVTVTGNYEDPNFYIVTRDVRKTLNAKISGMIPVAFDKGLAPYKVTLTSVPVGYTGPMTFTQASTGTLEVDNLPEGIYKLTLSDACGYTLPLIQVIGKVAVDFPPAFSINYVYPITYNNAGPVDCKTMTFRINHAVRMYDTHELYPYWKDPAKFYDLVLNEDVIATELPATVTSTYLVTSSTPNYIDYYATKTSLVSLKYADIYPAGTFPAGGHVANLKFKLKGLPFYSTPFSLVPLVPYHSTGITAQNYTCTGADLYVKQWSDYDGVICYPYTAEVFIAGTSTVVATKTNIQDHNSTLVGTVLYGKYNIVCTGSDGGKWTVTSRTSNPIYDVQRPIYSGYINRYQSCREDGKTGAIAVAASGGVITSSNFTYHIIGTTIKVKTAPVGQVIPPVYTVTTNETYAYPYGNSANLLPGIYVMEINNGCDPPSNITVLFPELDIAYTIYPYYTVTPCNLGQLNIYFYLSDNSKMPGGTTITYKGGTGDPASVIHKNFTMPSGSTVNFTPFNPDFTSTGYSNVATGTYIFDVWNSFCNITKTVTVTVPTLYSYNNDLAYTSEQTCAGLKVTPSGNIKRGGINTSTYYRIQSAKSFTGTDITDYDKSAITPGQSLLLQKSGTYVLQISGVSGNSSCAAGTVTINYTQPSPRLDFARTAAYVCGGETKGYIKLVASGGFGTGPYLYEIVGAALSNTAGEFNYGGPGETVKIKITDNSDKAIALGCQPSFEQSVSMLDLKDASIGYTSNNGNFCEGQTIELNCVSLGITKYNWTGPNGFTSTEQFPRITNATVAMSGDYWVNVTPENCGDLLHQKVTITVHPNPLAPVLAKSVVELCYKSVAPTFLAATGAVALAGHTLKWYQTDGMTLQTLTTIVTTSIYTATYYVSQVNTATGCESPRIPFSVNILALPLAPTVPTPEQKCWGNLLEFTVDPSDATYIYKVYQSSSSGGTPLDTKTGTGAKLTLSPGLYPNTTGSYYYYISTTNNKGCESSPRASVVVAAPLTAVSANVAIVGDTICYGGSATLTAKFVPSVNIPTITNPVYTWYNSSNGTTVVGTGPTFTTPALTGGTYYNVSIKGDGVCENPPGYRPYFYVRMLSYAQGYMITADNQTICEGQSTVIPVTSTYATIAPVVYNWYTSSTEIAPFFTGTSYTTPPLTTTTTYYVGVSNRAQYCENLPGNRKSITIAVNKKGVAPDIAVCPNATATIVVNNARNGVAYQVYDAPVGGNLKGSSTGSSAPNRSINLGTVTTDVIYYIQTNDAYCNSQARIPVRINLLQAPSAYEDIRLQVCPQIAGLLDLTKYINPVEFLSASWTSQSGISLVGGHQLNLADLSPGGTYSFAFKAINNCYPSKDGRLYVKALGVYGQKHYPLTQIKVCKDHASQLVFTQMMGIVEVPGGTWDFTALGSNITDYIQTINGTLVFNGTKAYLDGKGVDYLLIPGARLVTIQYAEPANACGPATTNKLDIVLTPEIN